MGLEVDPCRAEDGGGDAGSGRPRHEVAHDMGPLGRAAALDVAQHRRREARPGLGQGPAGRGDDRLRRGMAGGGGDRHDLGEAGVHQRGPALRRHDPADRRAHQAGGRRRRRGKKGKKTHRRSRKMRGGAMVLTPAEVGWKESVAVPQGVNPQFISWNAAA